MDSPLKLPASVTLSAMKALWLLCPILAAATTLARAQTAAADHHRRTGASPDDAVARREPVKVKTATLAAGVDVSGLSDAAALAKLKTALAPQLKTPIRLVIGDYQYTYTRDELGAEIPYAQLLRAARKNGVASAARGPAAARRR